MGEEIDPDEGLCDVGHHETPHQIPEYSQVTAERQPSVGGDGSAVTGAEVLAYTLPALWDQLAGEHAEVPARVYLELLLGRLVGKEEAGGCSADVCC
jgi:hypothetical protein